MAETKKSTAKKSTAKKSTTKKKSTQEYREPGFFNDYGGYAIQMLPDTRKKNTVGNK